MPLLKKHQIFPPCSFIDNPMKNIEISVTFKRINVLETRAHTTSLEAYVKSSRLYKRMNVIY